MHVVAATRLVLARRPWLYWAIVTVLAAGVAVAVHEQSSALDAARDDWRTTRTVLVAERALDPGDTIATRRVDLPVAALPPGALEELPDRATLSQRIGIGEVLTDVDITTRPGPAAHADPGTVVLAVPDPLSRASFVGLRVLVAADGQVLSSIGHHRRRRRRGQLRRRPRSRRCVRRGRGPGRFDHAALRAVRPVGPGAAVTRRLSTRRCGQCRTDGMIRAVHGRGSSQWWPTTEPCDRASRKSSRPSKSGIST